jgi:hypothetical protein
MNKQKLIKWIQSMGFELEQSIGIADGIVQKMLKPCAKLKLNPDYVLGKAMNNTNCTNLANLKENINFILKKEILKRQRLQENTKYIRSEPKVSKETLERYRSRVIN